MAEAGAKMRIAGLVLFSLLLTPILRGHDAYAEAHGIQAELDQTGPVRGRYLSLKEQGVSETLGMYYEPTSSRKPWPTLGDKQN